MKIDEKSELYVTTGSDFADLLMMWFVVFFQGLMHGPPVSQLPHHDPMQSHQPVHQHQQHHRQELSHHQQQQLNVNEPRSMMHHGQNLFHQQQVHGSPRQMSPRPQNPQQRNMSNRQRMVRDLRSS